MIGQHVPRVEIPQRLRMTQWRILSPKRAGSSTDMTGLTMRTLMPPIGCCDVG
jgi:hypothetical protein